MRSTERCSAADPESRATPQTSAFGSCNPQERVRSNSLWLSLVARPRIRVEPPTTSKSADACSASRLASVMAQSVACGRRRAIGATPALAAKKLRTDDHPRLTRRESASLAAPSPPESKRWKALDRRLASPGRGNHVVSNRAAPAGHPRRPGNCGSGGSARGSASAATVHASMRCGLGCGWGLGLFGEEAVAVDDGGGEVEQSAVADA